MRHFSGTLQTRDGLKLHTLTWLPDDTPRAVVLIVHGIAEYCGRYAHVAEAMVAQGYAVYSFDHRGHGYSEGERAYFDSIDQLAGDVKLCADHAVAGHPGKPFFVFGHSLGSLVSLVFTLKHQAMMAGWISSGSPLSAGNASPVLFAAVGALDRVAPKLPLLKLKSSAITRDAGTAAAYAADPLIDHRPTLTHVVYEIATTSRWVMNRLSEIRVPALVLAGEEDAIVSADGSRLLHKRLGSTDNTLKIYPRLYHEICNEAERDEVISDILAWLDARS